MDDVFIIEDFFDAELLDGVKQEMLSSGEFEEVIDPVGVFKGQLIVQQLKLASLDTPCMIEMLDKIKQVFDQPVIFKEINYQILNLPWDIHSDWFESDGSESYYNLLIPLEDVDSRTIIFDQRSNHTNHFYLYKKVNPKIKDPIPQDFWDENLSMCWPEDREYLTLKYACPYQKKGQLVGFKRDYYHSSDSFHLRNVGPKHFIQILVDKEITS